MTAEALPQTNLRLERLAQRLETERLLLRAFEPADALTLMSLIEASRAHLDPWLLWHQRMTSVDELERWAARPYDASEAYRMGVLRKADAQLVGAAGLRVRSTDGSSSWYWVDVNYWLCPKALGQGYATEAARCLARHAFDELGAQRVEIRTEPHNTASQRVAERLGFRREGVLRSVGHRRGGTVDMAVYSLIADERAVLDAG